MISVPYRETRQFTTALLEAVEAGTISADALVRDLLEWMSESEVERFGEQNDLWEESE